MRLRKLQFDCRVAVNPTSLHECHGRFVYRCLAGNTSQNAGLRHLAFVRPVLYNGAMAAETPPPPPLVPQTVPRTPPVAIWSLILGVLSFTCGWLFTAIPAVICGHIAWSKIRKSGGTLGGKNIATAGLILGYLALALSIMGIPLLVSMIQGERERLHRVENERQEIASDDGKIRVIVPA